MLYFLGILQKKFVTAEVGKEAKIIWRTTVHEACGPDMACPFPARWLHFALVAVNRKHHMMVSWGKPPFLGASHILCSLNQSWSSGIPLQA